MFTLVCTLPNVAYANSGELRAKLTLNAAHEATNIFDSKLEEERNKVLEDAQSVKESWDGYWTDVQKESYNDLVEKASSAISLKELENYQAGIDNLSTLGEEAKVKEEEAARKAAEEAAKKAEEERQSQVTSKSGGSTTNTTTTSTNGTSSIGLTGQQFKSQGVVYYNGIRFTYYSSKVLYHYRTSEWWLDDNGFYRDSEGYYVVACDFVSQGSIVSTPWGSGRVYDCGSGANTIDMYVGF